MLSKFLARAILRPTPVRAQASLMRRMARSRRIFDVISTLLQIRDSRRQKAIIGQYTTQDPYVRDVHDYNASQTVRKKITSTRRAEILYTAATQMRAPLESENLLIIGPRDVHELFMAWTYGFIWKNIHAIDLYATNPAIKVMNMEDMSFPDDQFHFVTMANTLAYAKDTQRCLAECARVLKPGGRLIFGATYSPGLDRFKGNSISGQEIAGMLKELGFRPFFYEPVDKINKLEHEQTVHFIGAVKNEPDIPGFDRIAWL